MLLLHLGTMPTLKCYVDPPIRFRFYSKPEVFRYLKTVKQNHSSSKKETAVSTQRTSKNCARKRIKLVNFSGGPLLLGPDAILNIKLLTEGRLLGLFEDTTNEAMPINPRVPSTCWQPAAMTVLFVERRGLQWTAVISVDTTNIMRPNTNQRLISEPRVFVEISISLIWFDIDLSQKVV
ncbi:hypothetical protein D5086_004646 [Populus alba]|uniref:Uncharacterized protein n=1 Tax=Populus alba TaxID=43335 RepID=A0ACC4CRG2_POPAL